MTVCEVCEGSSGAELVGVAAVPGVPVSITWCRDCIDNNAVPAWIANGMYIQLDGQDFADWWLEQRTPVSSNDGGPLSYITLREYYELNSSQLDVESQVFWAQAARGGCCGGDGGCACSTVEAPAFS